MLAKRNYRNASVKFMDKNFIDLICFWTNYHKLPLGGFQQPIFKM